MITIAVFMAVVGLLSLMAPAAPDETRGEQHARAAGVGFVRYAGAVAAFAADNPGFTGEAPRGALRLPPGLEAGALENWVGAAQVMAWLPPAAADAIGPGVADAALRASSGARSIGYKRGGELVSPWHGRLPGAAPARPPEGALVMRQGR